MIACLGCGVPYPKTGTPFICPACGGLFDDAMPVHWAPVNPKQAGVWRYASSMDVELPHVSLGEGNTPLVAEHVFSRRVYFKCEYLNPTGSFKDRGTATLISFLASRGVTRALEDSSGNAGASFAAYAARAGIKARVYVPESASGPKRRQIEKFGAEIMLVRGPRSAVAAAARKEADRGRIYASHAYLPHNLPGYATCAFEIFEQLQGAPGTVILPAGQGGLLLGMGRGFEALLAAGVISRLPILLGAQAAACAPLAAFSKGGASGLDAVTEGATVAEGVRVRWPLKVEAVVRMVQASGGHFVAVDEEQILLGRDALARMGFYVEPTSALVWHVLAASLPELSDPVVAVLTGSGYKTYI